MSSVEIVQSFCIFYQYVMAERYMCIIILHKPVLMEYLNLKEVHNFECVMYIFMSGA